MRLLHPLPYSARQGADSWKLLAGFGPFGPWIRDNLQSDAEGCSQAFLKAHNDYVSKAREELKTMPLSSRGWWKLSGTLLARAGARENIPLLQRHES